MSNFHFFINLVMLFSGLFINRSNFHSQFILIHLDFFRQIPLRISSFNLHYNVLKKYWWHQTITLIPYKRSKIVSVWVEDAIKALHWPIWKTTIQKNGNRPKSMKIDRNLVQISQNTSGKIKLLFWAKIRRNAENKFQTTK